MGKPRHQRGARGSADVTAARRTGHHARGGHRAGGPRPGGSPRPDRLDAALRHDPLRAVRPVRRHRRSSRRLLQPRSRADGRLCRTPGRDCAGLRPAAATATQSPRVAPGGTGGRIRQWQPTQIEPESASRLLPTISVRSGETPRRSQAVRNGSGAGLATPRSQDRTKTETKASRPVAAYPASMLQPVLLTIAIGIPAPLNAFRVAAVSGYGTIVSGLVFHSSYIASARPDAMSSKGAYAAT